MDDMAQALTKSSQKSRIDRLLAWYDVSARTMPWRARHGQRSDPYHVWLSEIMLQQTTVATVGPYFQKFLVAWPTVNELASADRDQVLAAWAGLGYYARARNLHKCAGVIAAAGGAFPDREDELRALPGIGPYTAAAIASIAFNRPVVPVDGNVERVVARLQAIEVALPECKPELRRLAQRFVDQARPGDVAQALMDLGATVCTPRKPKCGDCPLHAGCGALKKGIADESPRRLATKARPVRRAVAFWLQRPDGAVFMRRRPDQGLLGGMLEIPSTPWREEDWAADEVVGHAPIDYHWQPQAGGIGHTFTHFHLEVSVWHLEVAVWGAKFDGDLDGLWIQPQDFKDHAIPTLMRKIAAHALSENS